MIVHFCDWSQQPDIHLICGRWTTPSWTTRDDLPAFVYEEEMGEFYTFHVSDLLSCPECITKLTVKVL